MKKEEKKYIYLILFLSLLIIGLTLYAYWKNDFLNFNYFLGTDKLGHFGDFIGGFLGTILTGIATYLVYKTYISQKEELELQRKLIAQQQFENTFFNMLNVHRELKNSLSITSKIFFFEEFEIENLNSLIDNYKLQNDYINSIKYGELHKDKIDSYIKKIDSYLESIKENQKVSGIKVFRFIHQDLRMLFCNVQKNKEKRIFDNLNSIKDGFIKNEQYKILNKIEDKYYSFFGIESIEKIIYFYNILREFHPNVIKTYSYNVYSILKYIYQNEATELEYNRSQSERVKIKSKYKNYADIFQSQLNVDEQFLLFYNFIYFDDESKKELSTISICNHYKLFENIGIENLIDKEHAKFYNFEIK